MLLLAIQLTLTSPDVQCLNLRDRMQALEVAAQVAIGHIPQHWHFFARALATGVAATEELEADIQEEFVDETADLIDSLDRMAPELEACGDPPDRLAGLRKILDGAARAGMIRVNRLREGAMAGVSER
jgi:hypothetical protein